MSLLPRGLQNLLEQSSMCASLQRHGGSSPFTWRGINVALKLKASEVVTNTDRIQPQPAPHQARKLALTHFSLCTDS